MLRSEGGRERESDPTSPLHHGGRWEAHTRPPRTRTCTESRSNALRGDFRVDVHTGAQVSPLGCDVKSSVTKLDYE